MVIYKCHICEREFDRKYCLDSHLARKKPCKKSTGSKTNKTLIDPKCKRCGRTFSRRDSLNRHLKVCENIIKKNNVVKKSIIAKKNSTVKNTIVKNSTIKKNSDNNNIELKNNKININNYNPTFNLIVFGKDGTESLSVDDLAEIIKSNKNLYEELIKKINFNPNKPQHHNVYYSDMKAAYGKVYENKKWVDKKINEIINTLLDSKTEDLHKLLEKFDGILSKKIRQNIIKTIKDADYSNPDCRKKLISYIKPILYNNKDMVIKTKKILEELESDKNDDDDKLADQEIFKKGTKMSDVKKILNNKTIKSNKKN